MTTKLTLTALSIAATAVFAMPAPANAAESELTMPAGTAVPVGSGVTAVSANTVLTTPLGNLTCEKVTVNAEVQKNNPNDVKAVAANGRSTTSVCKLGSNSLDVTNLTVNSLTSTESGKGHAVFSFEMDFPSELTCSFESQAGGVPLTYTAGSSSLHLVGELLGSPSICGEEEEVFISGDFALSTTSGGGAVILD